MVKRVIRLPILVLGLLLLGTSVVVVLQLASILPDLSPHAVQRHQQVANVAWEYVNSLEHAEYCRWSCSDGRDRYVCGMHDGNFAIVVVEDGKLVTAFIGDQDYAKSIIDTPGCSNPFHYSHP